ncbi:MAG: DUF6259 domain-containing protein [Bacteroidales bacterium]|nr:DUF6259 domain-containing protein [Bacteroidales bacterium]
MSLKRISYLLCAPVLILCISCTDPELADFASHQGDWSVILEKVGSPEPEFTVADSLAATPSVRRGIGKIIVEYPSLGNYDIKVSLTFTRAASGQGFEVRPRIENNTDSLMVKAFCGPYIKGYDIDFDDYDLLVPYGPGRRMDRAPIDADVNDFSNLKDVGPAGLWKWLPEEKVYQIRGCYPGSFGASMQWYSFAGKDSGYYIASHDSTFSYKNILIRFFALSRTMEFGFQCFDACLPGESWNVPSTLLWKYSGTWHEGADYYREWFLTQKKIRTQPEWFRHASGWLLAILKQQNAEIIWNYADISGDLCKVADEHGLDFIGLFGWASGGHDRHYPDYIPDPEMGGTDGLKDAIARLKAKGKHVVIYANGILQDKEGSPWWEETGKYNSVVQKDSTIWTATWHKYYDAPARHHGIACLATEAWREKMLECAMQANDLGAEGIIFDCLGTGNRNYCYSTTHGHKAPMVAHANDLYDMLEYIRNEMQKVNPDFIIMTEGLCDIEMVYINCFHFCGYGIYWIWPGEINAMIFGCREGSFFPEMIRYTFPELASTCRIPSLAITPETLNYDTVFGFRSEIEARYAADRRYLVDRVIPSREDYGNVIDVPNLEVVLGQDYDYIRDLQKTVLDFQRKHSDILWNGRFVDTKGFSIESDSRYVMARAFECGDSLGVVVWNSSSKEDASFSLEVPGYSLLNTDSPAGLSFENGKLPVQSIQLCVYTKNK